MPKLALRLAVLACALLVPATAFAASPNVVISQVYGAGGNSGALVRNDYVELFNRGATSVPLDGWSVQYASATGTGSFGSNPITNLSGTLAPGQFFLVAEASGGTAGAPLPTPDVSGTVNMAAAAGKVAVVSSTAGLACNGGAGQPCSVAQLAQIVDLVGYGTANFFEGAAAAPAISATLADFRAGGGCTDTDSNSADFSIGAPNSRTTQTAPAPCGGGTTNPTATGAATPASVATGSSTLLTVTVSPGANPTSTGLAVVGDLGPIGGSATQPFFDDATNGDASAGDGVFSYRATVAAATAPGTKSLAAVAVDAQSRTASTSIPLTVTASAVITPIHTIQGSGAVSPLVGQTATVEGVVVGDFQGSAKLGGFYVQEEDADADADPATSEGIFVFGGGLDVNVGDVVRVTGKVQEFNEVTELSSVTSVTRSATGAHVTPAEISFPLAGVDALERFEGMSVVVDRPLTVTEVFNLGRYGEVSLSAAGRLFTPTALVPPGPAAEAQEAQNDANRIVLDDGITAQNPDPLAYPQGGLSASNTLRVGDSVPAGLTGVIDFARGAYRIQPTSTVTFDHTNPRTDAPENPGGNLRVASFNVLNYFNGDGVGGGFPTARGAENAFEFQRQRAKEVSALNAMNADVVGLMEMENDEGPTSAVADLVAGLNDALGAGTYAYIDTGIIGTDQIKVALIYKPAAVTPVGAWKILTSADDPRFDTSRNRPSLAQTFRQNATGRKLTVVVNHLKSKSSSCGAGDDDTSVGGAGQCDGTRTRAAAALVDWLKTDPTGSGDPDYLLIGDMNSYTFEKPIQTFVDGGLTNLVRKYDGLAGYSYVFDGESGYLDHALATPSLEAQVTGVTHWHINPDEPGVLDYNTNFKDVNQIDSFYSPTPYRASDHDPVVIGVALAPPPTANAGGPYTVAEGGSVALDGTGTGNGLTYSWDLDNDGTYETAGQTATFSAATIDGPATRQVSVKVSDGELSATAPATVTIANVAPTATLTAPATASAGLPFTVSMTGAADASAADVAAGFTYAFDCGTGFGPFSSTATASCASTTLGPLAVQAQIRDKDGGVSTSHATVTITVTTDSLCALISRYVANDGIANSLCVKLRQGTKAFANEVDAQAGKALTAEQGETLKRLARSV